MRITLLRIPIQVSVDLLSSIIYVFTKSNRSTVLCTLYIQNNQTQIDYIFHWFGSYAMLIYCDYAWYLIKSYWIIIASISNHDCKLISHSKHPNEMVPMPTACRIHSTQHLLYGNAFSIEIRSPLWIFVFVKMRVAAAVIQKKIYCAMEYFLSCKCFSIGSHTHSNGKKEPKDWKKKSCTFFSPFKDNQH